MQDWDSLTGRERTVVELIAAGLSAKEVSEELQISDRTVDRYVENARRKLRARNRTHLVTKAALTGAFTFSPCSALKGDTDEHSPAEPQLPFGWVA